MNSREATLLVSNVVVELKAIPMPMPKTNTPAKINIDKEVTFNGDLKPGALVGALVVVVDLVDLRLMFALINLLDLAGSFVNRYPFLSMPILLPKCLNNS
jgi:hypothetical protein